MVELKKELPEIFEEFAEQRKNSFLAIKKIGCRKRSSKKSMSID